MTTKIYKYMWRKGVDIILPKDSIILDMQLQDDDIYLWAMIDTSNEKVIRNINWAFTGFDCDYEICNSKYIATVQQGNLVWHLFDGGESNVD